MSRLSSLLCLAVVLALSRADELTAISEVAGDFSSGRIINGNPAPIERYPYTVILLRFGNFVCGGFLVTTGHILSAAHCTFDNWGNLVDAKHFAIRAGTSFIAMDSDGQKRNVVKYINHEDYNPRTLDCDIVLMVLESSVALNRRVQVASLPSPDFNVDYFEVVTAVGWGKTSTAPMSEVLKDVWVMKVNHTECAEAYERRATQLNRSYNVTENMFCTGWPGSGGMDACFGDSGGPVIFTEEGVQTVVGITSWGTNVCAHPDYMGVNVRLSLFDDWIWDNIRENSVPDDINTTESGSGTTESGSGTTESGSGTTESGSGTTENGSGTTESGSGTTEEGGGSTPEDGSNTTEEGGNVTDDGNADDGTDGASSTFASLAVLLVSLLGPLTVLRRY